MFNGQITILSHQIAYLPQQIPIMLGCMSPPFDETLHLPQHIPIMLGSLVTNALPFGER